MFNKHLTIILCFLWSGVAFTSHLSAAEITATIQSYSSASLSGDVTESMSVSFSNTSVSKGAVRANDTATLVISGLPACAITHIDAYLKSNKSSGAASVSLHLPNLDTLVLNGNYNTWQGTNESYSTTYLPIPILTTTHNVDYSSSLTLTIIGLTNSISIEKLTLAYTPSAEPHTVTLIYATPAGNQSMTLTETSPSAGVTLPQLPDDTYPAWTHAAWSYTPILHDTLSSTDIAPIWIPTGRTTPLHHYSSTPLLLYPNTGFQPVTDTTLYAVYHPTIDSITLTQDTAYQSGDYIIVMASPSGWRMLNDGVSGYAIRTEELLLDTLSSTDIAPIWTPARYSSTPLHHYTLTTTYIPDSFRYHLSFLQDSVIIYHPASQSWVGYSSSHKLNTQRTPWLWATHTNHSIEFYTPDTTVTGTYLLWLDYMSNPLTAAITLVNRTTIQEAWLLFNVTSVPSEPETLIYTSYPYSLTNIPDLPAQQKYPSCEKYFRHGHIVIQCSDHLYNLQGQRLH